MKSKFIILISFLLIPVSLLLIFSYLPLANIIYYSLTSWDGLGQTKEFVGLSNYIEVFKNPDYFTVFKTSIYYFIGGLFQMAIALYFATILSFKVRFKGFFKGVFFFPKPNKFCSNFIYVSSFL